MTIGPENFGNGAAKAEDRFAGQLGGYRPRSSVREAGVRDVDADELAPRNGVASLERTPLDIANPIASTLSASNLSDSPALSGLREPSFPTDAAFTTPVFPTQPSFGTTPSLSTDGWLDSAGTSVVDHPLLRGLLLELPAKGAHLQPEWLDRWFEAARSILELLYSFDGAKRS
jgi:hypothetical protein